MRRLGTAVLLCTALAGCVTPQPPTNERMALFSTVLAAQNETELTKVAGDADAKAEFRTALACAAVVSIYEDHYSEADPAATPAPACQEGLTAASDALIARADAVLPMTEKTRKTFHAREVVGVVGPLYTAEGAAEAARLSSELATCAARYPSEVPDSLVAQCPLDPAAPDLINVERQRSERDAADDAEAEDAS